MTLAIQQGYYLHSRNPSDTETLVDLAAEIGLDRDRFIQDLESTQTNDTLQEEIRKTRHLGIGGFPALLVDTGRKHVPVSIDYLRPESMLEEITAICRSQ